MPRPTRILHLIDSLGYGGSERQLALAVGALDRRRFENSVCYLHPEDHLTQRMEAEGIQVYGLNLPRGKRYWPKAVIQVRQLVRSLGIDLIHTSLFESDIIGAIAGRLAGVPSVSTLCNIGGERERLIDNPSLNRWKLTLTTKLWGLALRYGHRYCIANSNSVMKSAVRTYGLPQSKLHVIYRALSETWSRHGHGEQVEQLRNDLGLGDAYPLLLNVGRLVPQKGQRYLIHAMPEVLRQCPGAGLLIAGDGPLRGSLTSLAQSLGIADHVRFLGHRDDVQELLAASDLFAFPSLFEGCPNALIEAMAMAKPCVASSIGPNQEVIQNGVTGILVSPQSPDSLSEGIVRLAEDRELARTMGERGSQTVREKFDIDKSIKQLEAVYVQVLEWGTPSQVIREDVPVPKAETRR